MKVEKVWIGLANVAPSKEGKYDFDGAYVNMLSKAESHDDFICKIKNALTVMDLLLVEVEDVEKFSDRSSLYHVDSTLEELAREAELSGVMQFGTFHSYDADHEN